MLPTLYTLANPAAPMSGIFASLRKATGNALAAAVQFDGMVFELLGIKTRERRPDDSDQ
jgi:hypothetical protein